MEKSKDELIKIFNDLILEGAEVSKTQHPGYMNIIYLDTGRFNAWRDKTLTIIRLSNLDVVEIEETIKNLNPEYPSSVKALSNSLTSIIELLEVVELDRGKEKQFDCAKEIENIFNKFHKVARQLRTRHGNRQTLEIKDEYDVQDLMHALLTLHFDDVRREEWTPSYAGGSLRADFILKDYQTVIEIKKTRDSMTAKSLGEELLIDREKYKSHPDCKQFYCFVYDPEGILGNPIGLKKDLEKDHEGYIKVFIKPE